MVAAAMTLGASASAIAGRVTLKSAVSRRAVARPSRAVRPAPVRMQAIAAPTAGGDNEAPKPRTEAQRTNTSPLSAESAVPTNVKAKGEPVRIKIDDQWYDCAGWAKAHPGGERWIHFFDGRDGTDAFYALHSYGPNGSSKAADRLAKLPKCDPLPRRG